MFRKLLQKLDIRMVISDRAQRAAMHWSATGVSREIWHEGGLEIRPSDILPFFHDGNPPETDSARYQVGRVEEDGALRCMQGKYVPQIDSWQFSTGLRRRITEDRWIDVLEYRNAIALASQRAQTRLLNA